MIIKHLLINPLLVIMIVLAGCASNAAIDPTMLQAADYGAYPINYQDLIKAYYQETLKDPMSAQYRFNEPVKGYLRAAPISGGKPTSFGYVAEVGVNAKNSYGGYIGERRTRFFIKNGKLVGLISPNPWFNEPWYQE